jgi:hypothetical protein
MWIGPSCGTPLYHCVTSPPQGGRVGTQALRHPNTNMLDALGATGGVPLSPLVGEMSGRTEGGTRIPGQEGTFDELG